MDTSPNPFTKLRVRVENEHQHLVCPTHTHAHTHTHARTHTRMHAHTHTHTHTHIHIGSNNVADDDAQKAFVEQWIGSKRVRDLAPERNHGLFAHVSKTYALHSAHITLTRQ